MALLLMGVLIASCSCYANTWIKPPMQTLEGYPVPQPNTPAVLPDAHGAHPQYAIEWWYWVGHLKGTESGEDFGFQSTVFRLAGAPSHVVNQPESRVAFGDHQLYMSHAALSELTKQRYRSVERINREGWQAHASTGKLDLTSTPIRVFESSGTAAFELDFRLPDNVQVELSLQPLKPLVIFGERGLSRKGVDPAAVSLYWTYTRLQVKGRIIRDGEITEVEGIAWQDHEIASSQLGSDLVGWDWTAIQLYDGTEVKAYRLRKKDGSSDPWSALYWIDHSATVRGVYADRFKWQEEGYWSSPLTGLRYPTSVCIEATDPRDGVLKQYYLRPLLDDQEFVGNRKENPYWEGACRVLDGTGQEIGRAYLELAGYGGNLVKNLSD